MIYLDYASHTPASQNAIKEFCRIEEQFIGNPNASHAAGRLAQEEMERITARLANLLNVAASEIIYTSGASEANNMAIKGIARAYRHSGKHILSTCLEHPSVSGSLSFLQEQGYEIELINICTDGTVDLQHLKELLRQDTVLASVCYVDSELGAIQPIVEIAEILRKYPNCYFHVDATQAIGKIPVHFDGIDCLSFAPHKFHGLCGCGILLKRKDVVLEPLIHGGVSASLYRSGTPALALAASACTALEFALNEQKERFEKVSVLRRQIVEVLKKYPLVKINSPENRSSYILNLSVHGVNGDVFKTLLDERDVCVSVKSACSIPRTPSRPVLAVSKDKKNAMYSWRLSLSHLTTKEELDGFFTVFDECYKELTTR